MASVAISMSETEKERLKEAAKSKGLSVTGMVKKSLAQTERLNFDFTWEFRKCPLCGKAFVNFCVPCSRRQGKTTEEILADLGLTKLVPYSLYYEVNECN